MHPLLHGLNIGTLATWLSVAGLGTVGMVVPPPQPGPPIPEMRETRVLQGDFTLGGLGAASDEGNEFPLDSADAAPHAPDARDDVEPLPAPPILEPMAELTSLPEIPELPPVAGKTSSKPTKSLAQASRPAAGKAPRSGAVGAVGGPGKGGGSGSPSSRAGGGGGLSDSARLAAGRMPAPVYPAECRRKGQSGTVLVEFTVDTDGRVISAHAKSGTPWPLLNHEAVRTVRRWRFPPGGVMKLQRPIVFQLR